jgi:P4 family phage/plasmid primase-like protien
MENNTTMPETSDALKNYIDAQTAMKKPIAPGRITSILLSGIEKSTTFYCIKETDELIFYEHETKRYSDAGSKHVHGFCESVIRRAGVVHHVQTSPISEVEGHVRRMAYVPQSEFENENLGYLPLANGIYDLQTGELMEYCSEYRFLKTLAVEYKPDAKCPVFDKFLDDICVDSELAPDPKMRKAVIQLFAYCLWRAFPVQNVFFLIGGGANGKGVLLGTLQAFLGDENVANRSILSLSDNRFAGADLYRKHANISNELTVEEVSNVDLLKSLVSGTDHVSAERKHQQPFTFLNYAKIIIATNAPPKTKDATDGFYRRLNLIRFTRRFVGADDKKDLPEKLRQPEELSGILNLAIAELREWIKDGKFNPDSDFANYQPVDEKREIYERLADSIAAFRYDCLEITGDEDDCVAKDHLFMAYRDYCKKNKIGAQTETKFWRDFRTQTIGSVVDKRVGAGKIRSLAGLVIKDGKISKVATYPPFSPPAAIQTSGLYIIPKCLGEESTKNGGYCVTVLCDCVPWVGQDGITYGNWKVGEKVFLPKLEADWFVANKLGEYTKKEE